MWIVADRNAGISELGEASPNCGRIPTCVLPLLGGVTREVGGEASDAFWVLRENPNVPLSPHQYAAVVGSDGADLNDFVKAKACPGRFGVNKT